jgi:hypothetical protein
MISAGILCHYKGGWATKPRFTLVDGFASKKKCMRRVPNMPKPLKVVPPNQVVQSNYWVNYCKLPGSRLVYKRG